MSGAIIPNFPARSDSLQQWYAQVLHEHLILVFLRAVLSIIVMTQYEAKGGLLNKMILALSSEVLFLKKP